MALGRVSFTEENVKTSGLDFPKLKLQAVGEYARILCLEEPVGAYVHNLRKVKIVNGRPQTTLVERKDGTKVEDFVKDFVGQPLCLGDMGTLAERGSDPAHCPACAEAARGDMVEAPRRRFAMHVIRYQTKPNSAEILLPFQVQCVVWAFTDNVFTKLVTIRKEVQPDELSQHDLTLGPLQPPVNFQKFDIGVSMKAEWLASEKQRDLVLATYQQQQCPDLEAMIGRRVQARYMEEDIQVVRDSWQVANGFGNQPHFDQASAFDTSGAALGAGLTGLLNGVGAPQLGQPQVAPPASVPVPQYAPPVVSPPAAAVGGTVPAFAPPVAAPPVVAPPVVAPPSVASFAGLVPPLVPPPVQVPAAAQQGGVPLPQFAPPAVTTPSLADVGPAAPVADPSFVPGQTSSFDALLQGLPEV